MDLLATTLAIQNQVGVQMAYRFVMMPVGLSYVEFADGQKMHFNAKTVCWADVHRSIQIWLDIQASYGHVATFPLTGHRVR